MQFILVNGRSPSPAVFLHVVLASLSRTVMCEKIATRLSYCSIKCYVDHCIDTNARFSKITRGHHDPFNHFSPYNSSRDDENYETHRISPGCCGRQGLAHSR